MRPDLDLTASGTKSELVKTIPITRSAKPSRTTVMSVRLPDLSDATRIELAAEVTVTNTCVLPGPRCIGRRYGFSPAVGAQLRVAGRRGATGRRGTVALTDRKTLRCGQRRPNRNHHCPIVFGSSAPAGGVRSLPCAPRGCRLNLVLDAHHPEARPGNRLVIGTDRPDGSISQDRGRVSALVFREGFETTALRNSSDRRRRRHLPMVSGSLGHRKGGHAVVYSVRVLEVERGTVIGADATQRLAIGHLPYAAFMGAELILAQDSGATRPSSVVKRAATFNGHLSETNGFNCTQGPSAFRTPCETRKAGFVQIRNAPVQGGDPVPLYVNLVARTFPKLTSARGGDRARVLPGGGIDVVAYPPARVR